MKMRYFYVLLLGIVFLASGGVFVKLSELGPIATAFYRILLAMPLAWVWMWVATPVRARTGELPANRDLLILSLSGVFLALDLICWHISFHYTTMANANLLANLMPFVVIPLAWVLFQERIGRVFAVGLTVAVLGLYVLMSGKLNPSPAHFVGDFLAALTAVFYGAYFLTVGRLRRKFNAGEILFWGGFSAVAVLLAASLLFEGDIFPRTLLGWLTLSALAVFSHIGGQGLVAVSLGRMPLPFSSVVVLLQPVVAAFYALLIFQEKLSQWEIIGMLIVLAGIYIAKVGNADPSTTDDEKRVSKFPTHPITQTK